MILTKEKVIQTIRLLFEHTGIVNLFEKNFNTSTHDKILLNKYTTDNMASPRQHSIFLEENWEIANKLANYGIPCSISWMTRFIAKFQLKIRFMGGDF